MFLRQILHEDLGCASYLIGDERAGVSAVVDPRFDVDVYLDTAATLGVAIEAIFETHTHADHVSGHGRLAARTGAGIHVHRAAQPAYPHLPFEDGERWTFGGLLVEAVHTPGHRPEHSCLLLTDSVRGGPFAVLTGDSLLVAAIARPDLAIEAGEGARQLRRSIADRLLPLSDQIEVWPGHVGGSLCGGGLGMMTSSTIGFERDHGAAAAVADEERFVRETLAELGERPPNLEAIVAANRGPLATGDGVAPPISVAGLAATRTAGTLVVDVRDAAAFAAAHIPGSVSVPAARRGFANHLAWLCERAPRADVVLVGADDSEAERACRLAAAVALDRVRARLDGGISAWTAAGEPLAALRQVSAAGLAALLVAEPDLQILDVRRPENYAEGHIPGSVNLPWREIAGVPAAIDPERPVATVCVSGHQAGIAASLLQEAGLERVFQVAGGGVAEWAALPGNRLFGT